MEGITINGRLLSEFLIKNETLKEAVERRELFKTSSDRHYIDRHGKIKIESKRERNGRVIRLGQLEKNKMIYKERMIAALKNKDYKSASVIYLCCQENFVTSNKIADDIKKFAAAENVEIRDRIELNLRVITGLFVKREISKYIELIDSHFHKSKRIPKQIKIKDEFRDILTIDDAMRLSNMDLKEDKKDVVKAEDETKTNVKRQIFDFDRPELKEKFSIIFTGDISVNVQLK